MNPEVILIQSRFQHYKLMKSQIINYLFRLYYIHYCMSYFRTRKMKQNILHEHFQNKQLFIYAFLFHLFYFHTIYRFCFPKNTNADNICNVINVLTQSRQCYKLKF